MQNLIKQFGLMSFKNGTVYTINIISSHEICIVVTEINKFAEELADSVFWH